MKWLGIALLAAALTAAIVSIAIADDSLGSHVGDYRTGGLSLGAGGTVSSEVLFADGIEVTGIYDNLPGADSIVLDNNGLQCGWPTTDALADDLRIYGFSAPPIGAGANLVGQDVLVAAGQGSMTLVATVANCGAGDTVSVTIDGTTSTCTRDAATDSSTLFTCGATDAVMATNVAACLTQATGVAACAGAGCTLFTGVAGTAYLYRASNESAGAGAISVASSGNHAVAANGTDGVISIQSAIGGNGSAITFNDNLASSSATGPFVEDASCTATNPCFSNNAGFNSGFSVDTNGVGYYIYGSATSVTFNTTGSLGLIDNNDLVLGTGEDVNLVYATVQTPDSLFIGLSADSRAFLISENADSATDYSPCGGAACTNPTLIVQSADAATTTDNVRIFHDQTDGNIDTEGGDLLLKPAGLDVAVTGRISSPATTTITLDAATTIAITRNFETLACTGAESVATITGGASGQYLTIKFTDANCTLTNDDTGAANTIDLSAAFTSSDNDTVTFINDGTSWLEVARAVN